MTRKACVDKNGMKKGAWSEEEDDKLRSYILRYGHWNWRLLPNFAGLARCGKSCRFRWMNYLKPGLKRGCFTKEEEHLIAKLHDELGKKWSAIAARIPGRSDNEIKNFWHTHLKKRSSKTNTTIIIPSSSEITVCKNNASNSDQGREFSENFQTTTDKHIQLGSSGTLKTPNPGGVIWDSEDTAASSSSHCAAGREVEELDHMLSQAEVVIAENFDSPSLIDGISYSDGFDESFWTKPFMVDMTSYTQDHSFSPSLMLMFMEEQLNKTHQFTLPSM